MTHNKAGRPQYQQTNYTGVRKLTNREKAQLLRIYGSEKRDKNLSH